MIIFKLILVGDERYVLWATPIHLLKPELSLGLYKAEKEVIG